MEVQILDSLEKYKAIVCYHKFKQNLILDSHLDYLSKLDVLITVDDGDKSFYEIAFPLLSKRKLKAILFVITSLINTEQPFWWDEIRYYLGEVEGEKMLKRLKKVPNSVRLAYLENLRKQSDKPLLKYKQLTISQLRELQDAGIIIANHSHTHPIFDQCTEEEIRQELRASRKFFEKNGLKGYSIFAYPNGNYNKKIEIILREEGVDFAFLFDHKLNFHPVNPMRISRLSLNDNTPLWKLKLIVNGWHSLLLPFRKSLHKIVY